MNKRVKIILVFFIISILYIISYPNLAKAENNVDFTVSSTTARINDVANITVSVNNSVNVISGKLIITYNPTELELVIPENESQNLADSTFFKDTQVVVKTTEKGKITLVFAKANPITNTGTILNLSFKVLKEEGTSQITLDIPEYFDESGTQFTTNAINGTITSNKLLKGDINKDGEIRLYDALQILKQAIIGGDFTEEEIYIMDYNNDKKITLYDSLKFLQKAILG